MIASSIKSNIFKENLTASFLRLVQKKKRRNTSKFIGNDYHPDMKDRPRYHKKKNCRSISLITLQYTCKNS